jgi:hypothetical protein
MMDPFRSDRPATSADVSERDRDARVEELLLSGLDHYFEGRYDLAVNVWTRVLFIDRGHARARAYIERARGAIAERQREGEELLQTGAAAFHRGDAQTARELLTSAVERGTSVDEALAMLERIERLEAAAGHAPGPANHRRLAWSRGATAAEKTGRTSNSKILWVAGGVVLGIALAGTALIVLARSGQLPWNLASTKDSAAPATIAPAPLPIPTLAELSLARARSLDASQRPYEALEALRTIRPGDPLQARAEALAAQIQQRLLDAARNDPAAPPR